MGLHFPNLYQAMKICIFVGHRQMVVLRHEGETVSLPDFDDVKDFLVTRNELRTVHAESLDLLTCEADSWNGPADLPSVDFRSLFFEMDGNLFAAACKAKQIAFWESHSRFCPSCGTPTTLLTDIAKKCPTCGYEIYPPISPAIIVRIERGDDEILLVHAKNFRGDYYGLVAGFVETGETLEECVRREVYEETGLEISDLKYFASQSWPFPSGLMLGFTAKYAGGDIKIQEEELSDARFFKRGSLPAVPDKMSIARRLIDDWVERK